MKKTMVWSSALALAVPFVMFGSVQAAEPPSAQINPDGTKVHVEYPLEPEHQKILSEKENLVKMHQDVKAGKLDHKTFVKAQEAFESKVGKTNNAQTSLNKFDAATTLATPEYSAQNASKYIYSLLQEPQVNWYYCGPATVAEIVKSKGVNISQYDAGAYMGTTQNGTDWYNGTYPMRDALNHFLNTSYYEPYGTVVDAATFKSHVTYDIDGGWGVAGDAYEVPNGPHLVGHPVASTIYHWFAIDGYSNWGESTHYADSVSGATSISWYYNVPQYSTMNSNTVAVIVDERGIIW